MKVFKRFVIICIFISFLGLPKISLGNSYYVAEEKSKKEKTKEKFKKKEKKEGVKMEEMVVTATRTEENKNLLPQVVNEIFKKDIDLTTGDDLTDILKKNSSIDVIQYPGGYSGTISIRGVRSDYWGTIKHCLILIDGRPIGATHLAPINKDIIKKIEIIKGPSSALYGSDAMGGVVNIITKKSTGKIKPTILLGAGSFDSWTSGLSLGGNLTQKIDFDLNSDVHFQNGNMVMGNGEKRPNTSFKKYNNIGRIGLNLGNWRIDVKGNWYAGRDIEFPDDIDRDIQQKKRDVDQYGGDFTIKGPLGHNNEIKVTSYYSQEENDYRYEFKGTNPYRGFWNLYTWRGVQFQDIYHLHFHTLTFGCEYQKITEKGKAWNSDGSRKGPWRPDNEREIKSVFVEGIFKFYKNRIIATLGSRYDRIELTTKNTPYKTGFIPGSETFDTLNPSCGLKVFVTPEFSFHSTIGTAFVTPKPEEVAGIWVSPWGSVTKGNPDLDPENSVTWDAGISYINKKLGLDGDLTYFHTKIFDKIEKVKVAESLYSYENAEDAKIEGLEGNFSFDVGKIVQINKSLRFFLNFTRLFKAKENLSTGHQDIRNVAHLNLNGGIEYGDKYFNGRLTARYVGKRKDTDWTVRGAPEVENPSFTVFDLTLNFHPFKYGELNLQLQNIFDKYYWETKGYPLPGRSFLVKYILTF